MKPRTDTQLHQMETEILKEAVKWWVSFRPKSFSEDRHVRCWEVGINRNEDSSLARAVAKYIDIVGGTDEGL